MTDIVPIHCPHCGFGNSMVEAYEDDYGYWKVGCGACGSHSGTLHPNHKPDAKRLVIGSWNRRPEEDRLRQLLSEAEKREREARAKAPFEFDRYINGKLMAEGVRIERIDTLEKAMIVAAKIASRGPNGEVPVLVLRASATTQANDEAVIRSRAIEDVLSALTAHELYQYRPKAFQGFIDYARSALQSEER